MICAFGDDIHAKAWWYTKPAAWIKKERSNRFVLFWSGLRGSNPPPQPWQGCALPNELNPHMVPPVGIEPTTRRFSVSCSTNWATEANFLKKKWRPEGGSNPWPLAWQASALTNWATGPYGGNNRARTYDPLLVRQMLSQLSYASIFAAFLTRLCYYIKPLLVCQHLFLIF